jgi:dTDP-4-dehydrorhamnose reductase
MKLLIYGSNGWIAKQFIEVVKSYTYYPPNRLNLDIISGKSRLDNLEEIAKELDDIKPDRVISFTGRTHGITDDGKEWETIDYLEQPGKLLENVRDNLFGVVMLAMACRERCIHYTYLGTGCIFKYLEDDKHYGKAVDGFKEEDKPNFFGSSYSVVKGFTDMMMNSKYLKLGVLNLRIRMPITSKCESRNFITKITRYNKICSIHNSMTVLDDMLPIMLNMIINGKTGTFNMVNPGVISHNEILEMYRDIVDPNFHWENFTQEEQLKILSADRSNNYLDTEKLEMYYPDILPIKDSIKLCLIKYNKHWSYLPDTEKYWKSYH